MSELGGGTAGACGLPFGTTIDSHFKSNRPLSLIGHSSPERISLCCQQQTMERRGTCMEYIYKYTHTEKYTQGHLRFYTQQNSMNKHDPHAFLYPSHRLSSWLLLWSLICEDMNRTRHIGYGQTTQNQHGGVIPGWLQGNTREPSGATGLNPRCFLTRQGDATAALSP